jgi:hypothetical protein
VDLMPLSNADYSIHAAAAKALLVSSRMGEGKAAMHFSANAIILSPCQP